MRWKFSSFLPLGLLPYRSICQDLLIPDYVPRSLEPMAFWKSLWWNIRYLWFQQKVCLRIGTMALSQLLEFYLVHNPYDTWESYLLYNSCIEYNMASATTSQLLGSHTCTPRDFALYVPFWQCWLVFWINCTLWQKKKKLGSIDSFSIFIMVYVFCLFINLLWVPYLPEYWENHDCKSVDVSSKVYFVFSLQRAYMQIGKQHHILVWSSMWLATCCFYCATMLSKVIVTVCLPTARNTNLLL